MLLSSTWAAGGMYYFVAVSGWHKLESNEDSLKPITRYMIVHQSWCSELIAMRMDAKQSSTE